MRIVSVGEVLWDVLGSHEYLGGAPLNFSVHARRLGESALVVSAVGNDERGMRALRQIQGLGISVDGVTLQVSADHPTGAAIVKTDDAGNARFSIARPAAFDCVQVTDSFIQRIQEYGPDWFYFGTLAQTDARAESNLHRILECVTKAKRFYDINLREGHWNLPLVQRLSALADVIKLNESETQILFAQTQPGQTYQLEAFCEYWSKMWSIETICITLGGQGCAVFSKHALHYVRGFRVQVVDTVGAGDAFSAAFLHGMYSGWDITRSATFANALGALVASRAGATPVWTREECLALISKAAAEPHEKA